MKIIKSLLLLLLFSQLSFSQSLDYNSSSSSSMAALNIISVTIGGSFIVNGTFPASQTERVDQFITRIYNESKVATLTAVKDQDMFNRLKLEIEAFAKRDILLKRFDGEEIKLDLERFRLTGDFSLNPYLKNGDVIIFPVLDLDKNFIEITGAVNKELFVNQYSKRPLQIQYVEGDKLSDALLFAQGINPAYDNVTRAEISRLSYNGLTEEVIEVNIADDFELKVGDRIRIIADETQKRNFRVKIEGEVNKPGYIYITKDNTSIREVIKKAGGFKENAGLNRAELIRGSNVYNSPLFSLEFETIMMQRMSNIDLEDSVSFLIDNKLRYSRGNLTIDFERLFDDNFPDGDFIVKDNDYIFVPEKIDLIYVYGQVANPGYIEYSNDKDVYYYIDKAGGIGTTAKDEIYLIEGTTRSWIEVEEDEEYNISPGDFIWIPKDPPRDFDYYLNAELVILNMKNKTIAIYVEKYLTTSMTFIYRQLIGVNQEFNVIVLTSNEISNLDLFPYENIFSCKKSKIGNLFSKLKLKLMDHYLPIDPKLTFNQKKYFNRILKKHKVELIHAHFGPSALEILSTAQKNEIPLVVTFHGYDASILLKSNKYILNIRKLFNYAHILTVSRDMLEILSTHGLNRNNSSVVHCGIPIEQFRFKEKRVTK